MEHKKEKLLAILGLTLEPVALMLDLQYSSRDCYTSDDGEVMIPLPSHRTWRTTKFWERCCAVTTATCPSQRRRRSCPSGFLYYLRAVSFVLLQKDSTIELWDAAALQQRILPA